MERQGSAAYFYEGLTYAFLHSIILLNTEKLLLQRWRRHSPCRFFLFPVHPFISLSNDRPNIRLLRVQDALPYLFPLHIRSHPPFAGSTTNNHLSFTEETKPHISSSKLDSLDRFSYSPARPQVETREQPHSKANLDPNLHLA